MTGAFPSGITAGADGGMWFTMNQANAIGRIDPTDARISVHPLPTADAAPVGIAASATDGSLWFVEIGAGQIGRISSDAVIDEFPLPDRQARPHGVTVDAAGDAWFTEWAGNGVGRITPAGQIDRYPLPTAGSEPHGITIGPDGAVWAALEIGVIARCATT